MVEEPAARRMRRLIRILRSRHTNCMLRYWIVCSVLGAAVSLGHAAPSPLEAGYRHMYNLQFPEAHQSFAEWQSAHPQDPLGPASDAAAYLFSEFDRLHILQSEFFTHDEHFITDHKLTPDASLKQKFETELNQAKALAANVPQDANALFASVLCHGLQSDYLALIEKRYVPSFKEMKAARALAEQLLSQHPQYYDAWIAVGVENYMLSVKPAPIRWLLRIGGGETDRAVGLERLRLTAEKGHYLSPFARLLLAVAALRNHNTMQARDILEELAKQFPRNPLYVQELAKL
jgi:hypothetical protein